jgi:hypothetical protein
MLCTQVIHVRCWIRCLDNVLNPKGRPAIHIINLNDGKSLGQIAQLPITKTEFDGYRNSLENGWL